MSHEKESQAWDILNSCIGEDGIWADPTRYQWQCWTRDFAIAILPFLLQKRIHLDVVRKHLHNLSELQQPNGQIPIVFIDRVHEKEWVAAKEEKARANGKPSFMLERHKSGQLWNLTPGTRDSEILYLLAMYEYVQATGDDAFLYSHRSSVDAALRFIQDNLVKENGLVIGCDWRDTMEAELGNKQLLTNNCLLYRVYTLMEQVDYSVNHAPQLKAAILSHLCPGGTFIDYVGSNDFDPLGASFAVLFGIAGSEHTPNLLKSFASVDTPYGVTIRCKHNPLDEKERVMIEDTQGIVVWPFVIGFTVLALRKLGVVDVADAQYRKLISLSGFREYYDPRTGEGYGAAAQTWSSVLYLRCLL